MSEDQNTPVEETAAEAPQEGAENAPE